VCLLPPERILGVISLTYCFFEVSATKDGVFLRRTTVEWTETLGLTSGKSGWVGLLVCMKM